MACTQQQRNADGTFSLEHGLSDTCEFQTWANMLYRCHTETAPQYEAYGGRGIAVCERWRSSFELFLQDMGKRPDGCSLERMDVNGNYEPGNCRWASPTEQANNRRNTRRVGGMTLREISDLTGLSFNTIANRLRRGWSAERIINQPRRNYPEMSHADH